MRHYYPTYPGGECISTSENQTPSNFTAVTANSECPKCLTFVFADDNMTEWIRACAVSAFDHGVPKGFNPYTGKTDTDLMYSKVWDTAWAKRQNQFNYWEGVGLV